MMKIVDVGLLFQMNTYLVFQWKHIFLNDLFSIFCMQKKNPDWISKLRVEQKRFDESSFNHDLLEELHFSKKYNLNAEFQWLQKFS